MAKGVGEVLSVEHKALGCPYFVDMEESVSMKVLLSPGEARLRILHWLVERFYNPLVQPTEAVLRHCGNQALASFLSDMGLCCVDNLSLVEGQTSMQYQIQFLETLLKMVEMSCFDGSVTSQLESSCRFIDTLCSSEDLERDIFPRFLSLLPPDLPGGGNVVMQEACCPSLAELKREVERLKTVADEKEQKFNMLAQQHVFQEINNPALESCWKMLAVSLSMLTQLVVNFCHSYETELQPWVGHQPLPKTGYLGSTCKRTARCWQHVSKALFSLQQVEASLDELASIPDREKSSNLYPTCHKVEETLQQCIDVIGDLIPSRTLTPIDT